MSLGSYRANSSCRQPLFKVQVKQKMDIFNEERLEDAVRLIITQIKCIAHPSNQLKNKLTRPGGGKECLSQGKNFFI